MPTLTLGLSPLGPVVDVTVGISGAAEGALRQAGQPIPSAVQARFLIDTGASHTSVDKDLIQPLALVPKGFRGMHTPSTDGHPIQVPVYDLKITMPASWFPIVLDNIPVAGCGLGVQGIHGLIGRDIFTNGVLVYNGHAQYFTLAF